MSVIKSITIISDNGDYIEIDYKDLYNLAAKGIKDEDVTGIMDNIHDLLFAPFADVDFHEEHETEQ